MSSFLAYSYSRRLSQPLANAIDSETFENRKILYFTGIQLVNKRNFVKKSYGIMLGIVISFGSLQSAEAMGCLSISPIHKITHSNSLVNNRTSPVIKSRRSQIALKNSSIDRSFKKTIETRLIEKNFILQIRGGGLFEDIALLVFFFACFILQPLDTEAFLPLPMRQFENQHYRSEKFGFLRLKWPKNSRNCFDGNLVSKRVYPDYPFNHYHFANRMMSGRYAENGDLLSHSEAMALISEKYNGHLEINDMVRVSDWQAMKKLYHAIGLGIRPENFGFTQNELIKIFGPGGLVQYVKQGGRLPPIEFIHAYQSEIKNLVDDRLTVCENNATHTGGKTIREAIVYYNTKLLRMACFDKLTGELISARACSNQEINKFIELKNIGSQKSITITREPNK